MKRLATFAAILAIFAIQTAALADGFTEPAQYTGGDVDTAQVNADGYKTVLITKDDSDGTIVYIGQAANAFEGEKDFLIKSDPAIGKYVLKMGSKDGRSTYQTYFYVGVDSNNEEDLYMRRLQNERDNPDGSSDIGFYTTVSADIYNDYKSLKVGFKGGVTPPRYGGFSLKAGDYPTSYSGEGDLYLIFQLNGVPSAYKDSAAVYLSKSDVSDSLLGVD